MTNLIDRAKQFFGLDPLSNEAKRCVEEYLTDVSPSHYYDAKPADFEVGRRILVAEPAFQAAVLLAVMDVDNRTQEFRPQEFRLQGLRHQLISRKLPLSASDLETLLERSVKMDQYYGQWGAVLRKLRQHQDSGQPLTPRMRSGLNAMSQEVSKGSSIELRKIRNQIDDLLGKASNILPDPGESWADAVLAELEEMAPETRSAWSAVLAHAASADGARPSAKWLAAAQKHCQAVGRDEFNRRVTEWLEKAAPPAPFTEAAPRMPPMAAPTREFAQSPEYQKYQRANGQYWFRVREYLNRISEKNIAILKGLAWYAAGDDSAELARALGHMTQAAFTNVPNRGAWAKSAGNAAIWALGQMPNGVGVGPLARLRTRLQDRGALKLIASSIEAAAKNAGMTVDELEDLAVPTAGLDGNGARRETFGEEGAATLTLDAKTAKTNLQWFGADGKPRKAVPAAVKRDFGTEVKALKAAEDELRHALSAQSARFDQCLLNEREWTLADWRERYLSHPVLGNLARRLIWTVDGIPCLPDDLPADLPDAAPVCLWHPLGAPPEDVFRWRQTLESRGIVQPFKQAHREVYLLTDAERNTRTYSNRFAAHILKQHQFNSLCVLRGWKNTLRLMVDDTYPPATRALPQHNLRAEFWVEGIGDDYGVDTNDAGTYLRLATDQVRFYPLEASTNYAHAGGGGYGANGNPAPAEAVPLEDIPPLVFSEVMRDVDLFVGVSSVSNDPTWADGGPQGRFVNYWRDYSFGELTETARTRADVLARLLPRLKIAPRCRLDGRFLFVRGDLRTYKIHLGSGNILMEPNDQYLCIVPNSRGEDTGDLFLPFEGDRTLAVILSKALLLAADTQITDPTITRQIKV